MRVVPLVIATSVAVGVPFACGGAADSELFDAPLTTGDDDASWVDSGIPDTFDAGIVDQKVGDEDAGDDQGIDAPDDRPDVEELGPPDGGIQCGMGPGDTPIYCPPSSEVCCAESQGSEGSLQCTSPASCTGASAPLSCDSTEDCPEGQFCCGLRSGGQYEWVACQPSCSDVRFCNPDAVDCPAAISKCKASTLLPGYSTCQP